MVDQPTAEASTRRRCAKLNAVGFAGFQLNFAGLPCRAQEPAAGRLPGRVHSFGHSDQPAGGIVLKHAGLIVAERQGTVIRYSLNVSAFEEALAAVMDLMRTGADRKERSR